VIFFNLVIGLIGALQTFTQGYLITQGGPQNSTLFYGLYIYRSAFRDFKMGYAAALSWVLFLGFATLATSYTPRSHADVSQSWR
jgi:multiple sugar transport system permease protein